MDYSPWVAELDTTEHSAAGTQPMTSSEVVSAAVCEHSISSDPKVGLPVGASGKESTSECRRHKKHRFNPWVGKISQEKEMATHSSILSWRIPWTEELGGLQSMGCRVGHK